MSLSSALPLPLSADEPAPRPRWAVWRSPADQPAWARPALLGIAAVAALLPMGGFSGSVPEPTLARVKQLVSAGQLRFFMPGGGGFAGPGGLRAGSGGETAQIEAWVESSCHTVRVPGADSTGTLYQCGTR